MGNQESQIRKVQFQRGRDYISPIVISENVADRIRKASSRSQPGEGDQHLAFHAHHEPQSKVNDEPIHKDSGDDMKSEENNEEFPNVIADDGSRRTNLRSPGLAQQWFGVSMPLSSTVLSLAPTDYDKSTVKGTSSKIDSATVQAENKNSAAGGAKKDVPHYRASQPDAKGRHEPSSLEDLNPLSDASVNELDQAAGNLEKAYGTLSFNPVSPLEECLKYQKAVAKCYEENSQKALICSGFVKSYLSCCERQKQKVFRHLERTRTSAPD